MFHRHVVGSDDKRSLPRTHLERAVNSPVVLEELTALPNRGYDVVYGTIDSRCAVTPVFETGMFVASPIAYVFS